jgi:two-component system cell cycle response regulator DivK
MSKRILVVEDQEDNRQIIRDMLSATDYQITEAENGQEALAAVPLVRRPFLCPHYCNGSLPGARKPRRTPPRNSKKQLQVAVRRYRFRASRRGDRCTRSDVHYCRCY